MDVVAMVENNGNHSRDDDNNEHQQQELVPVDNTPDASLFEQAAEICTEELFDWMPLVDLHAVAQTCKRLQQLAGYIFRLNYAGAYVVCKKGNIFIGDVRINGFCDEIENIMFCDDDRRSFEFAKSHEFPQLKQVKFRGISFTDEKLRSILHILKKAEAVELYECTVQGEFYDEFLQHCPNITRLVVQPVNVRNQSSTNGILGYNDYFKTNLHSFIGTDNKWLLRQYPKIDYFGLHFDSFGFQCNELKSFFVRNPNIRKFATHGDNLVLTMDYWIYEAKLQLDDLAILLYDFESGMYEGLNKILPKNQFSQRTQVYNHGGGSVFEEYRHKYVPVELDKCHFPYWCALDEDCFPLVFSSFKEMCNMRLPTENIDEVVSTLVNLERISLSKATPKEVEALVSRAPKLSTITVSVAEDFAGGGVNLQKWNEQRASLAQANKVVIYVDETTYLAVKRTKNDMQHNFVALKRLDSCKWQHDFDYHVSSMNREMW